MRKKMKSWKGYKQYNYDVFTYEILKLTEEKEELDHSFNHELRHCLNCNEGT